MYNIREILVDIFYDTVNFWKEEPVLQQALNSSIENTEFYAADDYPDLKLSLNKNKSGNIQVVRAKTFQMAIDIHKKFNDKKIAVLNFASATHPGGGVKSGSRAQEESLCRCSTLYPTLIQKRLRDKYYDVNIKARNYYFSDACIYSPHIIICKSDDDIPERMKPDDFVTIDVITCAAPNLRYETEIEKREPNRTEKLYNLHVKRAKHIMHVAAFNNIDVLILGAFGCGAFRNDPDIVAKAFKSALSEYRYMFDEIIFAIYCNNYEIGNLEAFQSTFTAKQKAKELNV